MKSDNIFFRQALAYYLAELNVLPCKFNEKHPIIKWHEYQERRFNNEEFIKWFWYNPDEHKQIELCCVTGFSSNNLEVFDADNLEMYEAWNNSLPADLQDLVSELPMVRTRRGIQLWYRCDRIGRSQKLACSEPYLHAGDDDESPDTWLETKGHPGIAVLPSPFVTNRYWIRHCNLKFPWITIKQRIGLLDAAKKLDLFEKRNKKVSEKTKKQREEFRVLIQETKGLPQLDKFNWDNNNWDLILRNWKRLHTNYTGRTEWRRPGKDSGTSATTNAFDMFCFSTSTKLPELRFLTKLQVYANLYHNGDIRSAIEKIKTGQLF